MLLMPAAAHAASSGDDPVLVENSLVTIRKSDFDGEVDRLPAEIRPGFANSEKRVLPRFAAARGIGCSVTRQSAPSAALGSRTITNMVSAPRSIPAML